MKLVNVRSLGWALIHCDGVLMKMERGHRLAHGETAM